MANKNKLMRKVRQVLRLAGEAGLQKRQIARGLSTPPPTVEKYQRQAQAA